MDIPDGTIITGDMIEVKRPGTGIEPKYMKMVVGKRAKINIKKDDLITWNELNLI